jgi:hypothetical protein
VHLIAIKQDEDWNQLPSELNVVVDPTIFRTAEVFLQGEQAAQDKSALWQAISANVGSLAAFIDAIVLNPKLLFGGYAKRVGGQHLIQPKRARLYAAAALRDQLDDEELMFRRLERLPGEAPDDVEDAHAFPELPSFLPYLLLSDPDGPAQLFDRALKLRSSPAVAEYRKWHAELAKSISLGRRARKEAAEVSQIWEAVEKELQPRGERIRFTWSVEALFLGIPVPKARIEGEVEPRRFYAWTLRNLPGHRYQKLMMRMKAAHEEYARVDVHLRRLWRGR